ncbi:hypothetical protein K493DRAFT_406739 [Basidiobolus meristosporus CBS 931.73]|uniref:Yeast cell wall synthesis Kre9/Knh1-like N-terminal domain-containing protein n=1 Tax=Basidiobolus meristosporus CBS 931.73 TaxID=1314790 RepID=A0A1Y1YJE7_9FUNG|nr:hypothetical protein K493DRAFT_406739 [Basidiobolus meristosporus CBS 931.73]|eukprot:ORX97983.1 hypothetical protein K493DRAFT_406739 [Basidiobolus meristosporus CBS 931.73]
MTRLLQILGAAALAWNIVSAKITITSPAESEWYAGNEQYVKWEVNGTAPQLITINLLYGRKDDLEFKGNIRTDIDSDLGSCKWYVPVDTRSGTEYVVQIPSLASLVNKPETKTSSSSSSTATGSHHSEATQSPSTSDIKPKTEAEHKKNNGLRVGAGLLGAVGVIASTLLLTEIPNPQSDAPIAADTSRPDAEIRPEQKINCDELTNLDLKILGLPLRSCRS